MGRIEIALTRMAVATVLLFGEARSTVTTGGQQPNETPKQPTPIMREQDRCSSVLFGDEFEGDALDRNKWHVFEGNPTVNGGQLALSGPVDIQSIDKFNSGTLQGFIHSSDWKPQSGQFTDSSFGFETWEGNCHYGIIFKPSGHLAILRPQPDPNGNCSGDPQYQAYSLIPNWDKIRAGGTVSFTLDWCPDRVTLTVSGNGQEERVSYEGPAMPDVSLGIRWYSQPNETYTTDYIRLCAPYTVYLPIVLK